MTHRTRRVSYPCAGTLPPVNHRIVQHGVATSGRDRGTTGYPTDRQPAPNRSSIVTALGGESWYYLFEQLLD